MKKILDEYLKIKNQFNVLSSGEHRKRLYKDQREWWILGRFKMILDMENFNDKFPDYADKLPEDHTDFVISYNGKKVFKYIQITEIPPIEITNICRFNDHDIWAHYTTIINKKLTYDFGKNNWLLIYFDIAYGKIYSNGFWHNVILEISRRIDFSFCKYEKIFVIDSKGDAAVSLYPYLFVIRPEWCSGATIIDQLFLRQDNI
jgi:hypothetical protein